MVTTNQEIITQIQEANQQSAKAFWWLRNVNRNEATQLGVMRKIEEALQLLQDVDNLTIDVMITIRKQDPSK